MSKRPAPSQDEFDAWRDNPITRWVMGACAKAAAENRQSWIEASWGAGNADPLLLVELKTRADAYLALEQTRYEGWLETHGDMNER